jgi:rare lipoprotein A
LITSNWRLYVRGMLALASLSLAVSCATQQESPQSSLPQSAQAPPAVALSRPTAPRSRAKPSNPVRVSYEADANSGHRTASGERYDPNALTAASRTLPIGSSVLVTNPSTGRSVRVRINDRSGRARGRSLDLSKRAAEEIGMTKKGVTRVDVKRVDSKPDTIEAPDSPSTPKS